ncbi:helix-turn-helix domain-containing protein [Halocella sp. SP3-1]|uniref:helix-turn-helix domain-containing protein n=1 Tax=Halocella sp. SP3-1 TaxID=2382161 RepID=UPI000F764D01|nr:helix-turn-helix domain-containing protein [Halocella sp. SP3-1]AZO95486.1 helix-turn-helix domain-containing protein [Halocella sp. SP3-1]
MSIGAKLKEAREKQGLSLKDLQEKTKIRSKYLAALENEEYELIPGEAYVKAFIKGYADYLNLDGAQLVDKYNQIKEMERKAKEEEEEETIENEKNENPSILHNKVFLSSIVVLLILLVVGFVVYNVFLLNDSKNEVNNIADDNYNLDITANKKEIESENEVKQYDIVGNDYNKVEEVSSQAASSFNNESDQDETVLKSLDSKKKIVKLIVIDRTWIEIVVDGDKVFTGILKKGEEKEYSGYDKLNLTIGNAAGVKVEIDKQESGPWGRKGEVVKKEIKF